MAIVCIVVVVIACVHMRAGCMDTFLIRNNATTLEEVPSYYMTTYEWKSFKGNNSDDSGTLLFHNGFKGTQKEVGAAELFEHLCEWDSKNFIICAATSGRPGGSGCHDVKADGIADSHVSICTCGARIGLPCIPRPSRSVSAASVGRPMRSSPPRRACAASSTCCASEILGARASTQREAGKTEARCGSSTLARSQS
jgi:hypothetical protein